MLGSIICFEIVRGFCLFDELCPCHVDSIPLQHITQMGKIWMFDSHASILRHYYKFKLIFINKIQRVLD